MTKRERAKAEMTRKWEDLVTRGEWTAEEIAESLADQIEGYADLASEEMTDEMAEIMGWDLEEGMTDEQEAEWEEIVNETAREYLASHEISQMTEERAKEILMARGWDEIGAEEIIVELEIEEMTEEDLVAIAEDYEDR